MDETGASAFTAEATALFEAARRQVLGPSVSADPTDHTRASGRQVAIFASLALGPEGRGERYFGLRRGDGVRGGIAYVAPGVFLGRGDGARDDLRQHGERDRMERRAWEYVSGDSYSTNSYDKPALMLQTVEALVGDEAMTRVLRTYARRGPPISCGSRRSRRRP